jgi:hypothetical protein
MHLLISLIFLDDQAWTFSNMLLVWQKINMGTMLFKYISMLLELFPIFVFTCIIYNIDEWYILKPLVQPNYL